MLATAGLRADTSLEQTLLYTLDLQRDWPKLYTDVHTREKSSISEKIQFVDIG